jgi:hypothetical protein
MSELTPTLSAVGYYADQVGKLVSELQGIQYTLMNIHRWCLDPAFAEAPSAQSLAYLAGTAAGLRSRLEHALEAVERLAYAGETVAPKVRT